MRTAILVCVVLLSASACKTRPQPTLPRIPDSNQIGGGGSTELPGATVFHSIYRYTGHAAQAHAFYKPELTRRGAMQTGDVWADDNLEHAGPFGSGGSAIQKIPAGRASGWPSWSCRMRLASTSLSRCPNVRLRAFAFRLQILRRRALDSKGPDPLDRRSFPRPAAGFPCQPGSASGRGRHSLASLKSERSRSSRCTQW
jgi:hypothetical protein